MQILHSFDTAKYNFAQLCQPSLIIILSLCVSVTTIYHEEQTFHLDFTWDSTWHKGEMELKQL